MDLQFIAQKLQMVGFNIEPHELKLSGTWQSAKLFDNKSGKKSGRYIINDNLCSFINHKTNESGCIVLDKAKVVSKFELSIKRREFQKLERDKYFTRAIAAKEKFNSIISNDLQHSVYLRRKQVENFGCKIDCKGNLIVPLRSLDIKSDGTFTSYIRSLQTITPTGTKLLEPGCEKKGNMHMLGFNKIFQNPNNYTGTILIAEGYATAASIYMATNYPVVMAVDAGNLDTVMKKLTKVYSKAKFMICADNDRFTTRKLSDGTIKPWNVGVEAAKACQEKYGCLISIPKFNFVENTSHLSDFNDIHVIKGLRYLQVDLSGDLLNHTKAKFTLINNYTGEQKKVNNNKDILDYIRKICPEEVNQVEQMGIVEVKGGRTLHLTQEHPPTLAKLLSEKLNLEISCIQNEKPNNSNVIEEFSPNLTISS